MPLHCLALTFHCLFTALPLTFNCLFTPPSFDLSHCISTAVSHCPSLDLPPPLHRWSRSRRSPTFPGQSGAGATSWPSAAAARGGCWSAARDAFKCLVVVCCGGADVRGVLRWCVDDNVHSVGESLPMTTRWGCRSCCLARPGPSVSAHTTVSAYSLCESPQQWQCAAVDALESDRPGRSSSNGRGARKLDVHAAV